MVSDSKVDVTQVKRVAWRVPFGLRFTNRKYQKWTSTRILKKAKELEIDITDLDHKWELVDAIELHNMRQKFNEDHRSYQADPKRASFLDLPGELRNQIYELVLVHDLPIQVLKRGDTDRYHTLGDENEMHCEGSALQRLSWMSHTVRNEVRSFFYANNKFELRVRELSQSPIFTRFLKGIKADGRLRISSLVMELHPTAYLKSPLESWQTMFELLGQCTNLRSLELGTDLRYFLAWATSKENFRLEDDISASLWEDMPHHYHCPNPLSREEMQYPRGDLGVFEKTFRNHHNLQYVNLTFFEGRSNWASGTYMPTLIRGFLSNLEYGIRRGLEEGSPTVEVVLIHKVFTK